ncbi:hypothetical protein PIROE2DRAFT_4749, partial [Piromyces sp. E2]
DSFHDILQGEYPNNIKLNNKEEQEYNEKTFYQLKNIYNTCMEFNFNSDTKSEVLKNYLEKLNISEMKENIKDPKIFTNLLLKLHQNGVNSFVNIKLINDTKVYEKPLIMLNFNDDLFDGPSYLSFVNNVPEIITTFKKYVEITLQLLYGNEINIESKIESIMKTGLKLGEIYLNNIFKKIVSIRKYEPKNEELFKIEKLYELYPFIDWNVYLQEILKFYDMEEFLEGDPLIYDIYTNLYKNLNDFINEVDTDDLIEFIEWIIITNRLFDEIIPDDFVNIRIKSYGIMNTFLDEFVEENDLEALFPNNKKLDIDKEEQEEIKKSNNFFNMIYC